MKRFAVVLLCLGACGDDPEIKLPDAAPMPDGPPTMCPPVTAMPLPPGSFKLFLATEGVDLTPGPDNSALNQSGSITSPVTVPPFYMGDVSRQSSIESIAGYVQRALAPYSIDVVLQRPASGDYYMTVMGGTSQAVIGSPNILSVAQGYCNFASRNRVSLVFDLGSMAPQFYATSILSDFGAMLGMSPVNKAGDCMCRGGTTCSGPFSGMLCTFGVDVPVQQDSNACGRTMQNEPMHLAEALGCR